jgi:hypothetical protein
MSASLRPKSERTPSWIPDYVNRLVNAMETRSFKSTQMNNWKEGYDYPCDEEDTPTEYGEDERGCDKYHQQKDDAL